MHEFWVSYSSSSSLLCLCCWASTIYIINEVIHGIWVNYSNNSSSSSSILCLCHWANTIYIINEVMHGYWPNTIYNESVYALIFTKLH